MVNNAILSAVTWVAALRDAVAMRLTDESGQGILEYAVLVGAIIFAAAAILWAAGGFDFTAFRDAIQGCLDFDDTVCN